MNDAARTYNACIVNYLRGLRPIRSTDNTVSPDYPENGLDIHMATGKKCSLSQPRLVVRSDDVVRMLPAIEMQQLLAFYDQDTTGNLWRLKNRFASFIGVESMAFGFKERESSIPPMSRR